MINSGNTKPQLISRNASYFLRGIAMLMVLLSHYFEWGVPIIGESSFQHFLASLGDPGVGLFFLLSGYALTKSYGAKCTDKRYIFSRLKGVYIPYLILAGVVKLLNRGFTSPKEFLTYITGYDYWFMFVIFVIYIAYYILGKLPKWRITMMTLFIIDMSLLLYFKGYSVFWYDANWCFALGMIIANYDENWGIVRRGFSINFKDIVFVKLGQWSLYLYLIQTFVYYRLMSIPFLAGINWYLSIVIIFAITCVIAGAFALVYGSLTKKRSV